MDGKILGVVITHVPHIPNDVNQITLEKVVCEKDSSVSWRSTWIQLWQRRSTPSR